MENTMIDNACVLPNAEMQRFLVDLINQSAFKGSMAEFVLAVRQVLLEAEISSTSEM
jgi:hypothetical protein